MSFSFCKVGLLPASIGSCLYIKCEGINQNNTAQSCLLYRYRHNPVVLFLLDHRCVKWLPLKRLCCRFRSATVKAGLDGDPLDVNTKWQYRHLKIQLIKITWVVNSHQLY